MQESDFDRMCVDVKKEDIHPTIERDSDGIAGPWRSSTSASDLMMDIDEHQPASRVPNLARPMVGSPSRQITYSDVSRDIKAEPSQELPVALPARPAVVRDYLAAQRQLMQRRRAINANVNTSGSLENEEGPLPPPTPRFRGRQNDIPVISHDLVDERRNFEEAMDRESSDEWMGQGNNYEEDDELEKLNSRKRALEKKESQQRLDDIDATELNRARLAIRNIENRRQLVDRTQTDESMFVSDIEQVEDEESQERREMYRQRSSELFTENMRLDLGRRSLSGEAPPKLNKDGRPRKARGKAVKSAREFDAREKEKERNKKQKLKARQIGKSVQAQIRRAGTKTKGKVASKGKGTRATYKSRMRGGLGAGGALRSLLENLLVTDNIQDRVHQGDYGEAPVINERTKLGQFNALLASVGDDYDIHRKSIDKNALNKASRRFGYGKVTANGGKWLLKGMKSPLYHHQLLGADWMVGRELSEEKPHGGLLADAMGLGKTLEVLATMVGNPPSLQDIKRGVKSTLIVVPSSVITQWMEEIRSHVDEKIFPTLHHYKRSQNMELSMLQKADVVICSYAEVVNSYPYPSAKDQELWERPNGHQLWLKQAAESMGFLHQNEWYRVVLDEAQAIKNNSSQTSLACQNLKGKYRWALSGTPIQNRLDELFPYFRYLRAEWTSDFAEFRKHFCDPDAEDANQRIAVVLSIVMMRRTMRDRILGRPIVELPKIHPETKVITFSSAETALYRILESRFRDNLNRHFAAGTAERNYGVFMVQLLRLRQCTAHPFLLERTIKDLFTLEDVGKLSAEVNKQNGRSKYVYEQIEQWVHESAAEREAASREGRPSAPMPFGKDDFGKFFHMKDFLMTLNNEELMSRVVCFICGDVPRDPQSTTCRCIFCKSCIENHIHQEAATHDMEGIMTCPSCKRTFDAVTPYTGVILRDDDEVDRQQSQGSREKNKRQNHAPAINTECEWFKMVSRGKVKLLPSAKLIAVKAQILKWFDEAPNDKVLVFTQFRMMARLIGMICDRENWGYVYFTGDMNGAQRHAAVRKFHQDPRSRIMIASLKCGGQALNLTCANRVISIDLWWNHSVEQQAFGRVFRIGQHKETYVQRIVVRNTVDMRMLDMQADKVKLIDQALQDTGETVTPLSVTDLAQLFGHLREGSDGIKVVEADYQGDDEGTAGDDENDGGKGASDDE